MSLPIVALAVSAAIMAAAPVETAHYPYQDLGQVHVFAPSGPPRGVAVILSGDGGWKPWEASGRMAEALAQRGVLALGLNVNPTMAKMTSGGRPYDLAGEMQAVAADGAQRYHAAGPVYFGGYSAGATLAYAAAAQARPGEVAGLVTAGFCPDQDTGAPVGDAAGRSLGHRMKGVAGWVYRPTALTEPWGLVEGGEEHGCPGGSVDAFVKAVPSARLWTVPGVNHLFQPPSAWKPQLDAALDHAMGAPHDKL
ncbi:AcvB/VirJ family lysyl-phosphatidylglycerol hydrolase [Caulobacter soli]|uniref:AcvB/VirJ family lysyl-phosphatidylglycerol hydrolase n=1 Tax=Caulobacter soli TaxID=2708539 RepID=UPI0013EC257C|nr:AcvB/VirJ family lysyl-phosphatidylglycerol hydrolase [Caulobacter soli]